LVIVSIGYSACRWCHVKEHETFENSAAAAFMNEHFVNIKVNRKERPKCFGLEENLRHCPFSRVRRQETPFSPALQ
jgi:hypothetical protein